MSPQNSIEIVSLRNAEERNQFIRVPWQIQGDDPYWVAPLISRQKAFLDPRKGTFFKSGEAQLFLAKRNDRIVGRISAHVSKRYEEFQDGRTGFFGFFECENDPVAAGALVMAAEDWVRARGKSRLVGPMSFTIYDEIGILVDGFDSLAPVLCTHNPPEYGELLAGQGFKKAMDWFALQVISRDVLPAVAQAQARRLMKRTSFVMRAPTPREVIRRSAEILAVFNEAWEGNWGHIPFTQSEFDAILKDLRPLLRSDFIRIVLDGPRIVAFMITIPDINPVIQGFNGQLSIWNAIKLYRAAQHKPQKRVKTVLMGVDRAYRNDRLHEAMILDTIGYLLGAEPELERADCSLISEGLRGLIRSVEKYGVLPYKTYRIYEKELG